MQTALAPMISLGCEGVARRVAARVRRWLQLIGVSAGRRELATALADNHIGLVGSLCL